MKKGREESQEMQEVRVLMGEMVRKEREENRDCQEPPEPLVNQVKQEREVYQDFQEPSANQDPMEQQEQEESQDHLEMREKEGTVVFPEIKAHKVLRACQERKALMVAQAKMVFQVLLEEPEIEAYQDPLEVLVFLEILVSKVL